MQDWIPTLPQLLYWLVALVPAGFITVLLAAPKFVLRRFEVATDEYLKSRAKVLAREHGLPGIIKEVEETKTATARIEQKFAERKFVSERSYDYAAKVVERLVEPLYDCLDGHQQLLRSATAEREEREAEFPMTLPKMSGDERQRTYDRVEQKHDEYRRARAMAPVVLNERVVGILDAHETQWRELYRIPWERWEDDEEGHLLRLVEIEQAAYVSLCEAAHDLLLRPADG